jgi:hypothetical protein
MTNAAFPTRMLIDGHFVAGEGEAEKVLNPATGELLASVPEASVDQVHRPCPPRTVPSRPGARPRRWSARACC